MLLLLQPTFLFVALLGLIVAIKVVVSPSVNDTCVLSNEMLETFALTVMLQIAVFPPSSVVTVIVVVPAFNAVTLPSATIATEVSLLVQVTFLFVAFSGVMFANNVSISPSNKVAEFLSIDIFSTGYIFSLTVTLQVAVLPPSSVVTVIVVVPGLSAITTPSFTVATAVLLLLQVTFLLVAFSGFIVTVKVVVSPSVNTTSLLFKDTLDTNALTSISQVAVLPPSSVVTVIVVVPAFIAVTSPSITVATDVLLLFQVTFLLVAFSGLIVAVNNRVSPSLSVADTISNSTFSTGYTIATTVTLQVAVLPPSSDFAVIVAFPGLTAVTIPSSTVAIDESLEIHNTILFSAFDGDMVAVSF